MSSAVIVCKIKHWLAGFVQVRITTFETFASPKLGYNSGYVSHLECVSSISFRTYIYGFLDPESPNFDPYHIISQQY